MAFIVQARSDSWNGGAWGPAFTRDNPLGEGLLPEFFYDRSAEEISTFDSESAARAVLLALYLTFRRDEYEFRILTTESAAREVKVVDHKTGKEKPHGV